MVQDKITFQLATHFLSRIALRLEFLFKTANEACHETHEVIHRYALKNIVELINITEKPELKSRFIKELIRIEHVLRKKSDADHRPLLSLLEEQIHILNHVPGRFSNLIHEDVFLKTVQQIHHPNTQECEFSSPHLIMWFDLDPLLRQTAIKQWIDCFNDLQSTVCIYLSLLRTMSHYTSIHAHNGFYQHSFSPNTMNHLILLKIDKSLKITPKFQLGHNNLMIRLYELSSVMEIHNRNVPMDIAFCQI